MADLFHSNSRSARLDRVLHDLLGRAPELLASAVVSFDGLPMASALPVGMDEDRVAAMSAALLSLGERAAENFGRGTLNQVYVEGENGTVFLVSADDEAVLVAVGAKGAKVGLLMFEVRRSAMSVAEALRADDAQLGAATVPVPPTVLFEPVEPVESEEPYETYDVAPVAELTEAYAPEPEPAVSVPALHVVEGDGEMDEPEPGLAPAPLMPVPPVTAEPYEPYAAPYAEEVPVSPAPWGSPLTAVGPTDPPPRRDASHWTAYDQTGGEPGAWS